MKATIVILIFIISAFLIGKFTCKNKSNTTTSIEKIVVKIDTQIVYHKDTIYQNKLVPKTIYIKGEKEIQYIDTISDKNGNIAIITDTLNSDNIVGRQVNFNIKNTIIRDSIFIPIKQKLKINLLVGPNYNPFNHSIGGSMMLEYGKLNVNAGWNQNLIIGIGWRIK